MQPYARGTEFTEKSNCSRSDFMEKYEKPEMDIIQILNQILNDTAATSGQDSVTGT